MGHFSRAHYYDITGTDLKVFVKKVYELSKPRGYGVFQFDPSDLDDETVERIVNNSFNSPRSPIQLGFLKGRACKMTVTADNNRLYIQKSWHDHTPEQLEELLKVCKVN